MRADLAKRPPSGPEVEQPPLAPDLEWMLSSNQVSEALIAETIIKEHFAALFRLAHSLLSSEREAKQAAQEVILDACVNRRRYKGGEDVKAWLLGLMVDFCRRQPLLAGAPGAEMAPPAESPKGSQQALGESTEPALERILDGLTPSERLAAILHYAEGLSEAETARILRLKENQIGPTLDGLREHFEQIRPPEMPPWKLSNPG